MVSLPNEPDSPELPLAEAVSGSSSGETLTSTPDSQASEFVGNAKLSIEDLPFAEVIVLEEAPAVKPGIRVGSPFASEPIALPPRVSREDRYSARGGATAALAIGIWGCATCWIPTTQVAVTTVILVALLGLAIGSWGLVSSFHRRALWGIGLCALNIGLVSLLNVLRLPN